MTELKRDKTHKIELLEFDKRDSMYYVYEDLKMDKVDVLYSGRLDEVTEEQAKEWVEVVGKGDYLVYHKNYRDNEYPFLRALDSLKSATSKEWIIITKTKI